jgi:luciferase family oxidoreductase group 1
VTRLSILDLSPVPSGSTAGDALWNTVDLAEHADRLGFTRYWLAEHHNMGAVASSAPEVLIGLVGSRTKRIRVGAGGIMLPNHSPLKVAELFRVLAALFPDRIDLGLGRAAGTDPRTALELRRGKAITGAGEIEVELDRLLRLLDADETPRPPFSPSTVAIPTGEPRPLPFILGSSDYGGAMAARRGLGFAFAHHMNPGDAIEQLRGYRSSFRPSRHAAEPYAIVSCAVICAPTASEARDLARSAELGWIRFAQGDRDRPMPSLEEARDHEDDEDQAAIRAMFSDRMIVGDPKQVGERLEALRAACQADEIMVLTHVHEHAARRRSYELLAETLRAGSV